MQGLPRMLDTQKTQESNSSKVQDAIRKRTFESMSLYVAGDEQACSLIYAANRRRIISQPKACHSLTKDFRLGIPLV